MAPTERKRKKKIREDNTKMYTEFLIFHHAETMTTRKNIQEKLTIEERLMNGIDRFFFPYSQ